MIAEASGVRTSNLAAAAVQLRPFSCWLSRCSCLRCVIGRTARRRRGSDRRHRCPDPNAHRCCMPWLARRAVRPVIDPAAPRSCRPTVSPPPRHGSSWLSVLPAEQAAQRFRPDQLHRESDKPRHDDEPRPPFSRLIITHDPTTSTTTGTSRTSPPVTGCTRTPERNEALLVRALEKDCGSSKAFLVELKGIEPLTSSMPWKRSAN